ncbi:MAG: tryptophan synthase subunit alpha [Candidatus Paceibacterota bacterium]
MEPQIIPAIIPESFEHLKTELGLVKNFVPLVQVDITDGIFAPTITWPFDSAQDKPLLDEHFGKMVRQEEGMPFWQDLNFEMDLMIQNPEEMIDKWINIGASALIIHIESTNEIEKIIQKIKDMNIEVGVSLNPSTPNSKLDLILDKINFVQFMGNDRIGYHGVELDERVYKKIKELRNKNSQMPIAIDIGVNEETVTPLVKAGVTKLISGSTILNSDNIKEKIDELKNLSLNI